MVNPIGSSPAKSGLVADSPVGGDGDRRRARHFHERVDPLPIQSRRAHSRVDDRFDSGVSNLVLNPVVEVPPHEQIVGAEHPVAIGDDGVGMDDEHGELAVCGVAREPLLLLDERGQRAIRQSSSSGSSPSTARCAAAPPPCRRAGHRAGFDRAR